MTPETRNERATRYERWLLCSILLEPERLSELHCTREHFLTTTHGEIFQAMCNLADAGEALDILGVADELERISKSAGGFLYLASLYDEPGIVPANVGRYAREVIQASQQREFHKCREALALAETRTEQLKLLDSMRELVGAEL